MELTPLIQGEARQVIWNEIVNLERQLETLNTQARILAGQIASKWTILREVE